MMIVLIKLKSLYSKGMIVRILKTLTITTTAIWIGSAASAATIFNIDGPDDGSASFGENLSEKGASQSFTALQDLTNVSFGFDLRCLSCGGEIWLITGKPMNDAIISQRVSRASFNGFQGAQEALSGINLEAGTMYSLIMSMTTGNGIWRGTKSPSNEGAGILTAESDHLALTALDPNFLPWSPTRSDAGTLKFSISSVASGPIDVPAVPLPASVGFLLFGLSGFGALRALRRKPH